jgi:hypothetical protein
MLLKAKFALSPEIMRTLCDAETSANPDSQFFVIPSGFDPKKCDVVGAASPIMYLIGAVAARGEESLIGVTQV